MSYAVAVKYLAGTGPKQLGTWLPHFREEALLATQSAVEPWLEHDDVTLVSGFCEGFDEMIILVAQRLSLPYVGCIPNRGYGAYYWGKNSVTGKNRLPEFNRYVQGAVEVEYTNEWYNTTSLYRNGLHMNFWRNQRMVDRADALLAWARDKKTADGGTKDCIQRAINAGLYVEYLDDPQARLILG